MANVKIGDVTIKVDDAFTKLPPDQQDAVVKEIVGQMAQEQMPGWQSALRGFMDMGTFGYDDEIIAGLRSAFRGEDFNSALSAQREDKRVSRESHPWWYMGGNVVGAIPQLVVPALRGGGSLAAAAGSGALGGALYGSGSEDVSGDAPFLEQVKERAIGSLDDAALGAAGGALGYGVGKVATKAINSAGAGLRRMLPGSAPILNEQLAGGEVADMVSSAYGGAPDAVEQSIRGVRNGVPIAAQGGGLDEAAASAYRLASPGARQSAQDSLDALLSSQKDAVSSGLKSVTDGADNSFQWVDDHVKSIMKSASSEYDNVFARTPQVNEAVQDVVNSVTAGGEAGDQVVKVAKSMMPDFPDFTSGAASRQLTLREAETVRRALAVLGKSNDSNGAYYRAMEKMLRSTLDNNYSALKGVRAQWANNETIQDAFDLGRNVLSRDAEEVAFEVGKMKEPTRTAWAKGVWAALRKKLGTRSPESIGSLRAWAKTEDGQKILGLLGTGQNVDDVIAQIGKFEDLSKVKHAFTGNSATAARLAMDSRPKGKGAVRAALDTLMAFKTGGLWGAAGVLKKGLGRFFAESPEALRRFPPEVQDRILSMMISTDGDQLARALEAYQSGNQAAKETARKLIMNVMVRTLQGTSLGAQQQFEQARE